MAKSHQHFFYFYLQNYFYFKQAENGLQSRSSENGKTAVRHYGLKLQWYLSGDKDWRFGMVWQGLVWIGMIWNGLVGFGSYSLVWGGHMTSVDCKAWTVMDYHGLGHNGLS